MSYENKFQETRNTFSKIYKKTLCTNCGKLGHEFRCCHEPITSFGIINMKILGDSNCCESTFSPHVNETLLFRSKFSTTKNVHYKITSRKYPNVKCFVSNSIKLYDKPSIHSYKLDNETLPFENEEQLQKFAYYKHRILFMMVSRKFSLGFIEFIRGKYDVTNTQKIINLFEQMYDDEIKYIRCNSYDNILYHFLNRDQESKHDVLNRIYDGKYSNEYCEAKMKFNMLLNPSNTEDVPWDLNFYIKNIKPKWKKPEWGFPKGRREKNSEENIECACREFEEETGYHKDEYLVLNKIEPIDEVLRGTNGVYYKHTYYLSMDNSAHEPLESEFDMHEIGEIRWFTYDEAMCHIRPYHTEKKKILTRVYLFMLNYLIHNVGPTKITHTTSSSSPTTVPCAQISTSASPQVQVEC